MRNRAEKLRENVIGARRLLEERVKERNNLRSKIKEIDNEMETLKMTREVAQKAAELVQRKTIVAVEDVVNAALNDIFEGEYEFKIDLLVLRGKVAAELKLVRDGVEYTLTDTVGGGVIDVVSFALRIAFWAIRKDSAPVFILDEPMRFLSAGHVRNASELIRRLSEELGVQIIMVTHEPGFSDYADRVFLVKRNPLEPSNVEVVK